MTHLAGRGPLVDRSIGIAPIPRSRRSKKRGVSLLERPDARVHDMQVGAEHEQAGSPSFASVASTRDHD